MWNVTAKKEASFVPFTTVFTDFDILIRKRKSRHAFSRNDHSEHPSAIPVHPIKKRFSSSQKCNSLSTIKCDHPCYFSRMALLSVLVYLLYIVPLTTCKDINNHGIALARRFHGKNDSAESLANSVEIHKPLVHDYIDSVHNAVNKDHSQHRHRRHQRHQIVSNDSNVNDLANINNVQAIQPKICHSLTSSSSYLSSAFAHNFASQDQQQRSNNNELSLENKIALSPIIFQGKYFQMQVDMTINSFYKDERSQIQRLHNLSYDILGRMISRSNTYNSMYFVSVRAIQVPKGKIPRRQRSNVRLLFHTVSTSSFAKKLSSRRYR